MITKKIVDFLFEEVNKNNRKNIESVLKIKDRIALFLITLILILIPIIIGWIINNYGDKIQKYLMDVFNLGCS